MNDDNETTDFPPCELDEKDCNPFHSSFSCVHYLKYIILVGVIILGLFIFIIFFLKTKKEKEGGGFMILQYQVELDENIIMFNPTKELKTQDYSIEIINTGSMRYLEDNIEIKDNILKSGKEGNIDLKIIFKKELSSISSMFEDCKNLKSIDLSNLKTENIKSMNSTFLNCINLKNASFLFFNSDKIEIMDSAFENCKNLIDLNLSSFKTNNLKSMKSMFKNCTNLFKIDLSGFILNDNIDITKAFDNTNLQILILNDESSKNKLDPNHLYNNKTCQKGEGQLCKNCLYENNDLFKCSECNEGFYLPKDIIYPTKCKICMIENCRECFNNNVCNKCNSGYKLYNNGQQCNIIQDMNSETIINNNTSIDSDLNSNENESHTNNTEKTISLDFNSEEISFENLEEEEENKKENKISEEILSEQKEEENNEYNNSEDILSENEEEYNNSDENFYKDREEEENNEENNGSEEKLSENEEEE